MQAKYTLFVGPYPPPIQGQSFAFQMAYDHFNDYKILISQNLEAISKWRKVRQAIICVFSYLKVFASKKISVVYLAGSRSTLGSLKDIILINFAKKNDSKVILHIHAANFNLFLDRLPLLLKSIYLNAYNKVDCFICLMEEMKEEYKHFESTARIEVVNNFYDPQFDQSNLPMVEPGNKCVISYFSNLMYSKGLFTLIDAFNDLCAKNRNIELQIAGNFSTDEFMNADQVKQKLEIYLKSNTSIKYLGPKYGKSKLEFLNSSQIFVLPSFYTSEAFPISILEAMRCGNVIVLSDHHYLPYLINDKQGVIVPVKDTKKLVESLQLLIEEPKRVQAIRMGNQVYAKSNFSLEKYCNRINSIIQAFNFV